jgi:tetratricopeptide (TPR) repeat protein
MKKLSILILFLAAGFVQAQKTTVVSAFTYRNRGQLDKAKEAIDEATANDDTKNMAKTWFYRGNIYLDLYLTDNPKYKGLDTNALIVSYDAYMKAQQLDEKKEFTDQIKGPMYICGEQFYNKGVKFYNKKLYNEAMSCFEKTIGINNSFGVVDTNSYYNAALAAELSKDPNNVKKAKDYYKKLVDVKFRQPSVYSSLSKMFMNEKDTVKALNVIKKGRSVLGNNLELLISETNIYLASGKTREAQDNLKLAVEKDPKNPNLYFAIGSNYDQMANDPKTKPEDVLNAIAEAEKAYSKALELKPDYFDVVYNMGALFFNQGVKIVEDANKITDNALYAKEKERAEVAFKKALPFLEKAEQLMPNDKNTLISLKQLYARVNNKDRYNAIDAKLKTIK